MFIEQPRLHQACNKELWAIIANVVNFVVSGVIQWLVVVGLVMNVWVLSLVLDFREVMMTSPPDLANCGRGGSGCQDF